MTEIHVPYVTGTLVPMWRLMMERERRKKVIYVAGPYRDRRGEWHIRENIREAERLAAEIWQRGGVALCPHKNTAFFGGMPGTDDETWLQGDLELLRRCDAVAVTSRWRSSSGAIQEVSLARKEGIRVLYNYQELWDFLRIEDWRLR